MMLGRIEHRALLLDETFKQFSSLTLSLGPGEESGTYLMTAVSSIASAFLASQSTPTLSHLASYPEHRLLILINKLKNMAFAKSKPIIVN